MLLHLLSWFRVGRNLVKNKFKLTSNQQFKNTILKKKVSSEEEWSFKEDSGMVIINLFTLIVKFFGATKFWKF